jgi:hypothetical protein
MRTPRSSETFALRASEDQTAQLIHRAKTDPQRILTYDPEHRPEIASLLLTAALCTGASPADLADSLGGTVNLVRLPRDGKDRWAARRGWEELGWWVLRRRCTAVPLPGRDHQPLCGSITASR